MTYFPPAQGLYNPENESDNCGIGFVANIKGQKSFDIIQRGLDVLVNMTHRGAEGADNKTGDGAGIIIQIPHDFLTQQVTNLPSPGEYGTGLIFLPQDKKEAEQCIHELENTLNSEGLQVLTWRDVPTDDSALGDIAKSAEPTIKQIFVTTINDKQSTINATQETWFNQELEVKLYIVRKLVEKQIRNSNLKQKD